MFTVPEGLNNELYLSFIVPVFTHLESCVMIRIGSYYELSTLLLIKYQTLHRILLLEFWIFQLLHYWCCVRVNKYVFFLAGCIYFCKDLIFMHDLFSQIYKNKNNYLYFVFNIYTLWSQKNICNLFSRDCELVKFVFPLFEKVAKHTTSKNFD